MDKEKFSEIINKLKNERYANVLSVFATKNPENETPEQVYAIQEKFLTLPEAIKNKIVSEETSKKIQTAGINFNLELLQIASIARAIRNYYFGEIQLENFPKIFSEEMGIDLNKAQEISNLVIQRIINDNSQEKEYQSQLENLTLQEALKKYSELGEQLITSNKIKIKNFPEPVRPSIKNWLSDYTFNMGYDPHNSMVRGEFLFRNENARQLSQIDKQKLEYILKAYDENTRVTVNANLKQVIFPKTETAALPYQAGKQAISPNNNIKNSADINSSPHFGLEKKPDWRENFNEPEDMFQSRRNAANDFFQKSAPKNLPTIDLSAQKNIIRPNFASPEDKPDFSLGKHEPPKKPEPEKNKITFTSPQRMPFEKPAEPEKDISNNIPQPLIINPGRYEKNVVNLKE